MIIINVLIKFKGANTILKKYGSLPDALNNILPLSNIPNPLPKRPRKLNDYHL